jgi:hypothetical protein
MWTIVYTIEANNGDTDDFATPNTLLNRQMNITVLSGQKRSMLPATGLRNFDYFSIVKEGNFMFGYW